MKGKRDHVDLGLHMTRGEISSTLTEKIPPHSPSNTWANYFFLGASRADTEACYKQEEDTQVNMQSSAGNKTQPDLRFCGTKGRRTEVFSLGTLSTLLGCT